MHEELVAFVIDELKRYQLIDERRRVTAKGLELVRTGTESYEIKTGYVYYNYVTKTFMDAFVPDDKHNEVETGSRYDGRIKFDLGTVANREWKNGIILNVDTSATVESTPYDVIAICKKHNRRTRNLGFMDEETDDIKSIAEAEKEKNRGDDMDLPWEIQSVKMLGTQKDVYVATYLFMAMDDVIVLGIDDLFQHPIGRDIFGLPGHPLEGDVVKMIAVRNDAVRRVFVVVSGGHRRFPARLLEHFQVWQVELHNMGFHHRSHKQHLFHPASLPSVLFRFSQPGKWSQSRFYCTPFSDEMQP